MMMNPDDPRLTAYALGELSGEEAIEFERILAENEELQEALEEIREAADNVREALGDESASILTSEQEELMVANAIAGDPETKIVRTPFYRNPAYLSLAAAIVMVFSLLGFLTFMNIPAYNKGRPSVHVVETRTVPAQTAPPAGGFQSVGEISLGSICPE